MKGSDSVGTSTLEGFLIFKADNFGIHLSKVYDDRSSARQKGKFFNLLYEGAGTPNYLSG